MTDQQEGSSGLGRYARRINRMLEIVTLVQKSVRSGEPYTPARLAERFQTTERTIYRDLDALRQAGIPIDFERSAGTYTIGEGYFMPPLHLTAEEALALSALCEHIGEREQIPFLDAATRALHKVESQLPTGIRAELEEQRAHLSIRTAAAMEGDGYGDVYESVQFALADGCMLSCRYESVSASDEDKQAFFAMRPLAIFFSVRAWYVIGERLGADDDCEGPVDESNLRCFKLSRFTKCEPTERAFTVPPGPDGAPGFDLDVYLGNAWRMMRGSDVDVEIWFDPQFAHTASDTCWHRTQMIEWNADGSCVFRCTVSGLDEIEWWVLSMGPHCRVIAPAELAERVRDLAARTAALYEEV